jgi:alkyldihydroxyacetonephosphate synthase
MHEIAMLRAAPVSIRLVDNMQFQFGQALKPEVHDWKEHMMDKAKKWYVIKHKKFDPEHMTAATLLMEGTAEEIKAQERTIYTIAAKYGGLKAGETNGIRGYFLTYMIAYLRDFGFDYQFIAESFETSVPWDHVYAVCQNVKNRIREDAKEQGIKFPPFVSCRVTQTYDNGACIYFYFGFIWTGLANPTNTFDIIEHNAREEILKLGGSLSHHHGVGKLRKSFMSDSVSPVGVKVLQGLKQAVDPKNIFANGNLIDLPTSA